MAKRAAVVLLIIVGVLTLMEFIAPGHLDLLMSYIAGTGELISVRWGSS
jgi:hypothetical protein